VNQTGSFLLHSFLGARHFFDGGPLLNSSIEIAAADLKRRQPMSKHTFISSELFHRGSNTPLHDKRLVHPSDSTPF
jgi:hypothetical protein